MGRPSCWGRELGRAHDNVRRKVRASVASTYVHPAKHLFYTMPIPKHSKKKRIPMQCFIKCLRKEDVYIGATYLFTHCRVWVTDCQEESEILRKCFSLHFLVMTQLQ